ncbi:MAG: hypothetical protein OMM_14021 [Candidatus Magnetoglobus multicellularis str. Araruama]|uniref:Porin domain-containing protein n=1 Tax=Candidatus Magnetoglobus multicellularis str. Araruama TaxID=890399 RepID=A0A1V1NSN1_9BACT|nr:MAG: hypothetical protein OMM_14021 [Candidatus Magnetoglobus multicellularis str. Araruama]
MNHWVWTETAAGLTYHGKSPSCKWMIGWYRGDENTKSNSTDNNYFVLKASGPLSPELELGLFMVYEHAGAEETSVYEPKSLTPTEFEIDKDKYDRKIYYLGTTLALDSQPFTGKFEIIYQGGDISFIDDDIDDLERGAMLIHMDMGFQVNQQLKVGVNSLYVSGDDNPNDQDANNFDAIDVDVKVGMMLFKNHLVSSCDRFVSDAPYILDKGLMHHALTADYKLNKKHSFFTAIRRLALTKDIADESDLGMELDFKYAYKFNKYVKLRLESACLLPGGASDLMTADGQDADTNVTVAAGIQFKF